MQVKGIIWEDFINYKKPSMTIMFPYCNFKCEKECGLQVCQNNKLVTAPNIEVYNHSIIKRYLNNPISKAIVFQGLEPIDSFIDIYDFLTILRYEKKCNDMVVIYTGYKEEEIWDKIEILKNFKPIIIKFGRYIPNQKSHYDDILGVNLASDNQYAKII